MKLTPGPWRWESLPGARGKKRRVLMGGTPGGPQHKILSQASDVVGMDSVHERAIALVPDLLAACRQAEIIFRAEGSPTAEAFARLIAKVEGA